MPLVVLVGQKKAVAIAVKNIWPATLVQTEFHHQDVWLT
jgi:hypothetical protein